VLLAFVLLLAGVVVGVLRGGSLENINRVRFRLPWLVLLGLALQMGAETAAVRFPGIHPAVAGPIALAISYALLATFVALNVRFPGALLIGLGLFLNVSVILANGGMPVSHWAATVSGWHATPNVLHSVKHKWMDRGTRLGFLGDIIPVPPLGIVSVGDVVLGAGVFLLVNHLMAPTNRHRSRENRKAENRKGENGSEGGPGHRHGPNTPEPPPCRG
jgi:hypothetical protein